VETYPVIEVPDDASTQLEQLGTKGKFWYEDETGRRCLFKEGRPGSGENWAEKVACEIAKALGLPHAHYDLACYRGRMGVSSPSLVPEGGRLILGNEVLSKQVDGYDPDSRYQARQHTLRRVIAVLRAPDVALPIDWTGPLKSPAEIFVGYLLLDALIGNQDRHHENWALVSVPGMGISLSATFDHASSLGRNETDEKRIERLNTRDQGRSVARYVARARSGLYASNRSDAKPMSTVAAFEMGCSLQPAGGEYWLARLGTLTVEQFSHWLAAVPDAWISQPARDFAVEMLKINRQRVLDSRGNHP